ncbi:MAG: hypothetical protein AAFY41_10070 [Bacteroidota bacterium]
MNKLLLLYLMMLGGYCAQSQIWTETSLDLTSPGTTVSKIQFAEHAWSGSHGILFNAYKDISVNGSLSSGNTKFANNVGSYTGGAGAIFFYGNGGVMDFQITGTSAGKGQVVDWGAPELRIQRGGFIGIGTSNPAQKLTVMNGQMFFGNTTTNRFETGRIRFSEHVSSYQGAFIHYNGETDILHLGVHSSNDTQRLNDLNTISILRSNGNVGIGTEEPSEKLSVNGTIRSKEVLVEASPWPDYVFAKDYDLLDVYEVEAYIQKNGHLPRIPSAKEVETGGIALAKMNALLLEKIEELTLYTIQQQKQLDVQKELIEELLKKEK